MTATELTESTERGVWDGKSISVFSVAESYKKQIRFSRKWQAHLNTRINTLKHMAHKTLTISEEAYKSLVQLKKEGESFTALINRITGIVRKKPLKEFAGRLKDDEFEKAAIEIRSSGTDISRLERSKL